MSEGKGICRLCGHKGLGLVDELRDLSMVTSDCRPFSRTALVACCPACGGVQKITDDAWREGTAEIYAAYEPYHQAGGAEQRVFDGSGASQARSLKFLDHLLTTAGASGTGRLLDVGCGSGTLLKAMHELRPGWKLTGSELGGAQREAVLARPGVEGFCFGPLTDIEDHFDLVTMVHVLEHVEDPAAFLRQGAGLVVDGGAVGVQVPDHTQNPFDLLIFDHCTHFTADTLAVTAGRAGLGGVVTDDRVPKELSATFWTDREPDEIQVDPEGAFKAVRAAARWLGAVRDAAVKAANAGPVSVFGTAIGGSWLAGELAGNVDCFVDEDPDRMGRDYLGRPVCAPENLPKGIVLAVPLAPVVARTVGQRMAQLGHECLLPPMEVQ